MSTTKELINAASDSTPKPKLKRRYELIERFGQNVHNWYIESAKGIVCLHITDGREADSADSHDRVYGGIEIYTKEPPKGREYDAPDIKGLRLLNCDAWHDGTSMGAESICDFFKSEPTGGNAKLPGIANHEIYFAELMRWAEGRILLPFADAEVES